MFSTAYTFQTVIDREKVSTWIKKLDGMNDGDDQLERVNYIKYLVATLSGALGLVEPFSSTPPEIVQPLQLIVHPVVFADVLRRTGTVFKANQISML